MIGNGWTKAGQPRMGATLVVDVPDGDRETVKLVAKMWGRGGSADLYAIIVEWPDGERQTWGWGQVRPHVVEVRR